MLKMVIDTWPGVRSGGQCPVEDEDLQNGEKFFLFVCLSTLWLAIRPLRLALRPLWLKISKVSELN